MMDELLNNIVSKDSDKNTTSKKFKEDLFAYFNKPQFKALKALELGCNNGYTTLVLSHLFKKVYAVDKDEWCIENAKNINKDRGNVIIEKKDVYIDSFSYPTDIRVIWIDAGHDYNSIKFDIARCKNIFNNPIFIFDDYAHPNVGVKQAIHELIDSGEVEKIEWIGELGKNLKSAKNTQFRENDYEGLILHLKKKSDYIFMMNIKLNGDGRWSNSRSLPYKYSISSWKKWAEKNNKEIILLEELIHPINEMGICWQRYYLFDLFENQNIKFNQIALVDADTIIHPDTPDFFEKTNYDFTTASFEGSWDWVIRSMEVYSKFIFNGWFDLTKYFDAGFMIVNKNHLPLFSNILDFYNKNVIQLKELENFHLGTDQTPINFMLHINGYPLTQLSYQYNMVDMNRKEILTNDLLFTKLGYVYQYNAIPNNQNNEATLYWMKKTYEYFYGEY